MSELPLRITVVDEVQERLDAHADWWFDNRKEARVSFGDALIAAYETIENKPDCGTVYEHERVPGMRVLKLTTRHMLYFTVIDQPPQQPYVLIVGVKGPGEKQPFMAL